VSSQVRLSQRRSVCLAIDDDRTGLLEPTVNFDDGLAGGSCDTPNSAQHVLQIDFGQDG
jgi:hypothetical protein